MCHKRHLKWVVYHHGVGVLFFEIPRQHVGDYAISRTTQHPHLGSEHARLQCRAAFQEVDVLWFVARVVSKKIRLLGRARDINKVRLSNL